MSEPEKTNLDVEEYSSQGMRNIRLGIPQGYTLHEPFRDYWPNVVFGIGKAEVILALFGFGYLLLTRLTISTAQVPTIFVLLAILLQLMLMIILGLLILYIVAVFVILALHSLFGVLNTDCENIFCGVFVGGTIGLVITLPCWLLSSFFINLFWIGASTVFGQLGGAWGARKSLRYMHSSEEDIPTWPTSFQFGVRQLLLLTLWCVIILTGLKLAGVLTERFLTSIAFWSTLQLVGVAVLAAIDRILNGIRRSVPRETGKATG